jgi:hypothetical protein
LLPFERHHPVNQDLPSGSANAPPQNVSKTELDWGGSFWRALVWALAPSAVALAGGMMNPQMGVFVSVSLLWVGVPLIAIIAGLSHRSYKVALLTAPLLLVSAVVVTALLSSWVTRAPAGTRPAVPRRIPARSVSLGHVPDVTHWRGRGGWPLDKGEAVRESPLG